MSEELSIAGSAPFPVRRPASVSEVCQIVAEARSQNLGIYPVGGRTMLDLGQTPKKRGIAVDLTQLAAVVDYPARDMTITAHAGITIAKLHEALAKEGQWLPVDVPHPEKATLGGAIATNVSGSHRFGYGTLRDYVIGMSFVTDEAVEVKGGGRVVKNVAGYDFMKLQTGAMGTLGIITQVTLKVKPRPESSAAILFGCSSGEQAKVLELLHKSNSRPVAVEVLNEAACEAAGMKPQGDWLFAIGFEEKAVTVAWQRDTLLNELKALGMRNLTDTPSGDVAKLWQTLANLQILPESKSIGKLSVKPSEIAERLTRENREGAILHSQPLNGIIWRHSETPLTDEWQSRRGVGNRARTGAEWELMKQVKKTLDPNDLFNPGRLFG